jgi:NAD-dependent SIR2 family protein deacetylase
MAVVRCEKCGAPAGVRHRYLAAVKPLGYPNAAVLCCRRGCLRPGLVWLNEKDKANYAAGEMEIVIWGQNVKIRVV